MKSAKAENDRAKPETKTSKATKKPLVKAAPKGTPFNGDWNSIPSSRQLLALVIRSIETGVPFGLPVTRDAARAMLGYDKPEASPTIPAAPASGARLKTG